MRYVTNRDNAQRSGPHRRVEKLLDKIGISYMSEHPFLPYTVDIYLPEFYAAVEIDGPLHSKTKDHVRDQFLDAYYHLPVLRLEANIWDSSKAIQDKIIAFIEEHAYTAADRKASAPR